MRRIALLGLFLSLTGCSGFGQFIENTHTLNPSPNMPPGDSENMKRVMGQDIDQPALTTEPGNIWPPPAGPMPSLMDLEKQSGQNYEAPGPMPTSSMGATPPSVPAGGLGAEPPMALPPGTTQPTMRPSSGPMAKPAPPGSGSGSGAATGSSSSGAGSSSGGAGQSIVVPNGNGTSTIIHPDGTVETVPTPKP